MVRVTVNIPEAAAAVPEIKKRMLDAGVEAPLIGDFHYNGHVLLTKYPDCAARARQVPDQSRQRRHGRAARRAVRDDLPHRRATTASRSASASTAARSTRSSSWRRCRRTPTAISGRPRKRSSTSAWCSRRCSRPSSRSQSGLRKDQIIISCKVSRPLDLIAVYRELAARTDQPLHLGLTEAGMGMKGLVWSASAMGVLLNEGIGDTIRVSLTPRPGGDRREEVYAACELLQSLGHPLVRAERDRVPRLRPHDLDDVPGAGRADPGLRARPDAGLEDAARGRREHDARGDGVRRQRPGRVEGREHRHLAAGHRRGAALPRLHRRPALHDAEGHATRSSPTAFRALVDDYVATKYPGGSPRAPSRPEPGRAPQGCAFDVLSMNPATSALNAFSDGSRMYIMWPAG